MKKFLFSAVALTAFSFSSMANNEVKEKPTQKQVEESKTEVVLKLNVCDQLAANVYNQGINNGLSSEQAYNNSSNAYNDCIGLYEAYDVELPDAP